MSDLHARHEVQQSGGAVVPAGAEAADQARTARAEAMRSGDRAAVEKFDREEYLALGGEVETERAGEVVEDGPPDASIWSIAASRYEAADTGAYADLIMDWGRPNEVGFQQNYALAEQLSGEIGAKYPGLNEALGTAVYQVDGEWKPLRDNAAVVRMLAHVARKLQGSNAPKSQAQGKGRTMPAQTQTIHDRIDALRAEKRLAQAEGNRRRVSELDEAERRLWEQAGHVGPPVGQGGRLY